MLYKKKYFGNVAPAEIKKGLCADHWAVAIAWVASRWFVRRYQPWHLQSIWGTGPGLEELGFWGTWVVVSWILWAGSCNGKFSLIPEEPHHAVTPGQNRTWHLDRFLAWCSNFIYSCWTSEWLGKWVNEWVRSFSGPWSSCGINLPHVFPWLLYGCMLVSMWITWGSC